MEGKKGECSSFILCVSSVRSFRLFVFLPFRLFCLPPGFSSFLPFIHFFPFPFNLPITKLNGIFHRLLFFLETSQNDEARTTAQSEIQRTKRCNSALGPGEGLPPARGEDLGLARLRARASGRAGWPISTRCCAMPSPVEGLRRRSEMTWCDSDCTRNGECSCASVCARVRAQLRLRRRRWRHRT